MRTKTPLQAEKMLDAAARLFGQMRYHEVRMEDIASEAAVGKGTLYRYFADKDELYLALLARAANQMQERMKSSIDGNVDCRKKLIALVNACVDFFDEQPHVATLIQRAEAIRGPESPWQPARESAVQLVEELFATAASRGDFCIRIPERAVQMLLGGIRNIVLFGKKPREKRLAEGIVADFLDGAAG